MNESIPEISEEQEEEEKEVSSEISSSLSFDQETKLNTQRNEKLFSDPPPVISQTQINLNSQQMKHDPPMDPQIDAQDPGIRYQSAEDD